MSIAGFSLPTLLVHSPASHPPEFNTAGERRVNLVRLAALLVFYANHLLNISFAHNDPLTTGRPHTAATALVLAWALSVVLIHLHLFLGHTPRWLGLAAVAADVLFITLLLCLSHDPRSGMSGLYFLVVLSAAVRLSLPMVYVAVLAAVAGYGVFQAYTSHVWVAAGIQGISGTSQVFFALTLVAAGFLAGQMVRQSLRQTRDDRSPRFCPRCAEPLSGRVEAPVEDGERRRDHLLVGAGLVVLGGLLAIALLLPASNVNLELDTLFGLGIGLVLLVATGGMLQFRRKDLSQGLARGGQTRAAFAGLEIVLGFALLSAMAIAVTKTFF